MRLRRRHDDSVMALKDRPEAGDYSGITLCLDQTKPPEAMQRIKEFRRSLGEFVVVGDATAVYWLSIQLFPLKKSVP